MNDAAILELARCKRLLETRTGKDGYNQNCEAIKARIAELEKELAQ